MSDKPEITATHARAVLLCAYEALEDGEATKGLILLQAAYYLLHETVGL